MANVVEAARQVFRVLGEFNETEVSPSDRFACLTLIEKAINPLRATLKKQYLGKALSLTDNQINVMHFAEALDQELAVGYKTVLETSANRFFRSKATLAGANYRAMSVLSKILIRRYQLYTSPPRTVWREIHALFSHGIDNKYLKLEVTNSNDTVHNLESLYLKIILLYLTNPCQLRQVDAEYLYTQFDDLVLAIRLEETDKLDQEYYVDLLSDHPPMFCFDSETDTTEEPEIRRTVLIDVESLKDHLQDLLKQAPKETTKVTRTKTSGMDPIILRHLISAITKPAPRSYSRTQSKGSLPVSVGIASTNTVIAEHLRIEAESKDEEEDLIEQVGQSYDEIKSGESQDRNNKLSITDEWVSPDQLVDDRNKFNVEKTDVWTQSQQASKTNKSDKHINLPNPLEPNKSAGKAVMTEASLLDLSPGGYCLAFDVELPAQLMVEEIVGLHNIQNAVQDWSIGIVRWIKSKNTRSFTIGIQSLSPKATPINSQVLDREGKSTSYQRTLLVPATAGISQTDTLLTPPIPYRVGEKVRFTDGHSEHVVQLTKLVNSSHCFKQFEFTPVKRDHKEIVNKLAKEREKEESDELDDLPKWDIL